MINDKLENIEKYNTIPADVKDFIKNLTPDIECKRYILNNNNYANVEEYNTKNFESTKFEAHNQYIDIQLLLKGSERIDYVERKNLECDIPYNKEKDICFFKDTVYTNTVHLDGTNFMLIETNEAHRPQISHDNKCEKVKKVVVKIKTLN